MKRRIAGLVCAAAVSVQLGLTAVTASAADTITVDVTISNAGTLTVPAQSVTVTDRNGDGKFDLDEALYAAHEAYYEGGAAAGYRSAESDYGLSMEKLWGADNGAFGYYLNDQFAMSLLDEVKAGDRVAAFVYSDAVSWSDSYCYFDQTNMQDAKQGDEVSLKLSKFTFGADGSASAVPASGAYITIDGKKTAYQTDENGAVRVRLDQAGEQIISAVSDQDVLVPTALRVTVAAADTTAANTTAAPSKTTTSAAKNNQAKASKTGDTTAIPALALTVLLAGGAAIACRRRHE